MSPWTVKNPHSKILARWTGLFERQSFPPQFWPRASLGLLRYLKKKITEFFTVSLSTGFWNAFPLPRLSFDLAETSSRYFFEYDLKLRGSEPSSYISSAVSHLFICILIYLYLFIIAVFSCISHFPINFYPCNIPRVETKKYINWKYHHIFHPL